MDSITERSSGQRVALAAAIGLGTALLAGGCAMMTPKAAHYVAPPVGSTWTAKLHNTGSFGSGDVQLTTRRGERTWEGKQVITFTSQQGTIVAQTDGAWLANLGPGDKVLLRFDPPANFDYPLEVGKTWSTKNQRWILGNDRTLVFDVTCTIPAYEDVAIPAGTFKAFRVECAYSNGTESVTWFSSDLGIFLKQVSKRAQNFPLGAGSRTSEIVSQTITQ